MKHLYYTLLGMVMLIAACSSPYQPPKPDAPTADMLTIDTTIYTFDTFFMQLNVREIPTQAGGGPYEHSFSVEGLPPNARGGFTKPQGTGSFDNTFYLMPYNTPEGKYTTRIVTTSSDNNTPSTLPINITVKHCTDSAFYSIINLHVGQGEFKFTDVNTGVRRTMSTIFFHPQNYELHLGAIYNIQLDTSVFSSPYDPWWSTSGNDVNCIINYSTDFSIEIPRRLTAGLRQYAYMVEGNGKIDVKAQTITLDYYSQRYDGFQNLPAGPRRHYVLTGPMKF